MTDGQTEALQQIDTDAEPFVGKDPYLTVIELQILGILRSVHHEHLSVRSMVFTLNTTRQKIHGAIEQSNQLTFDVASGTVSRVERSEQ